MSTTGRVDAIWIKRAKRGPMDPAELVMARAGAGLEGNADQGGRRQVTIISTESWAAAAAEVDGDPDPVLRRANLLVSGLELARSRGKVLEVGGTSIRIFGETRPCNRMEESHTGLLAALEPDWRAGAFGEVLADGEIKLGDAARWAGSSES